MAEHAFAYAPGGYAAVVVGSTCVLCALPPTDARLGAFRQAVLAGAPLETALVTLGTPATGAFPAFGAAALHGDEAEIVLHGVVGMTSDGTTLTPADASGRIRVWLGSLSLQLSLASQAEAWWPIPGGVVAAGSLRVMTVAEPSESAPVSGEAPQASPMPVAPGAGTGYGGASGAVPEVAPPPEVTAPPSLGDAATTGNALTHQPARAAGEPDGAAVPAPSLTGGGSTGAGMTGDVAESSAPVAETPAPPLVRPARSRRSLGETQTRVATTSADELGDLAASGNATPEDSIAWGGTSGRPFIAAFDWRAESPRTTPRAPMVAPPVAPFARAGVLPPSANAFSRVVAPPPPASDTWESVAPPPAEDSPDPVVAPAPPAADPYLAPAAVPPPAARRPEVPTVVAPATAIAAPVPSAVDLDRLPPPSPASLVERVDRPVSPPVPVRSPVADPGPTDAPDTDDEVDLGGRTIRRSRLPVASELVTAIVCPSGHLNPQFVERCRVCQQLIPPQVPQQVVRPSLGVLRLSNGAVLTLDRGAILGRNPRPIPGATGVSPSLVRISDPTRDVSSQHLEVRLEGLFVTVRDLNSTNGTQVVLPGCAPAELHPNEPFTLEPGSRVLLASTFEFVFEAA